MIVGHPDHIKIIVRVSFLEQRGRHFLLGPDAKSSPHFPRNGAKKRGERRIFFLAAKTKVWSGNIQPELLKAPFCSTYTEIQTYWVPKKFYAFRPVSPETGRTIFVRSQKKCRPRRSKKLTLTIILICSGCPTIIDGALKGTVLLYV